MSVETSQREGWTLGWLVCWFRVQAFIALSFAFCGDTVHSLADSSSGLSSCASVCPSNVTSLPRFVPPNNLSCLYPRLLQDFRYRPFKLFSPMSSCHVHFRTLASITRLSSHVCAFVTPHASTHSRTHLTHLQLCRAPRRSSAFLHNKSVPFCGALVNCVGVAFALH